MLVVPRGTDVLALAAAWFPGAAWSIPPVQAGASGRMTGARFRGMAAQPATGSAGLLQLDATMTLHGPIALDADAARELGLAPRDVDAYALASADPAVRLQGAAMDLVTGWLVAAARRSGGAIVPADRARLVQPDPSAAVDLTLWSAVPMSAHEAVPLVRPALHGARIGAGEVPSQAYAPEGAFSVTAVFEYDGAVTVRADRSTDVPMVLSTLDWREYGPWAYHVVWQPTSPEELTMDQPSPLHVIARSRVSPGIARATAALWRAVGGSVVDSMGFLVTPDELRERASNIAR
ncbi:hypothetical protein Cch01nite_42120 [Cellulomonas chitinilytica]|uniref:Uncharacterized protein n=1 Tax=Cellulomonas chitinilytica TaxID=398759 RepID=A0A919P7L6_9CELL|nr:hypothetical protein Cch01nite_42120 [Cellulomonas chitinilytica]